MKKPTSLGFTQALEHSSNILIRLDKNNKIIDFQEKPKNPKSTLISTAVYFLSKSDLEIINKYLKSKHKGDTFGHFLKYLYQVEEIYGFVSEKNFLDIGNLKDYKKANKICEGW